MAKGMRSILGISKNKLIYIFLFLIVAFGLYYLFRTHFAFREGQTTAQTPSPKYLEKSTNLYRFLFYFYITLVDATENNKSLPSIEIVKGKIPFVKEEAKSIIERIEKMINDIYSIKSEPEKQKKKMNDIKKQLQEAGINKPEFKQFLNKEDQTDTKPIKIFDETANNSFNPITDLVFRNFMPTPAPTPTRK